MNCLTKTAALALILVIALPSLTFITSKPVTAQATVTPSVPEFSLKVIDHSYDVPPKPQPTTSTDPDTGDPTTTTTVPGYHVDNKTIQITIKNQQFTSDGKNNLYYNISYRGHRHNNENWKYYIVYGVDLAEDTEPQFYSQSTSDYTVIEMAAPYTGEIEVRIRAQIGNYFGYYSNPIMQVFREVSIGFEGKLGSWSSPQTINIPSGSTSADTPTPTSIDTASPTSTNNPTSTTQINGIQTENSIPITVFLLAVAALVAIITVLLILLITRKPKPPAIQ